MTADNALKYVGPIMDAYNAAENAGATALSHALECGKHLCAAFNTVVAAKGKWNKWREKNLKGVSEETEEIYPPPRSRYWEAERYLCKLQKHSRRTQALINA